MLNLNADAHELRTVTARGSRAVRRKRAGNEAKRVRADGDQHSFAFPALPKSKLRPGEIVVDLFAGGGGASTALEQALGRPVDIAINHDEWAIGMHAVNHPFTLHQRENVWRACPLRLVAGRPVGWLHLSPDCTHFTQASAGQPRKSEIRSLAWAGIKWAGRLAKAGCAPRIISLENVRQMLLWGRLIAKRCKRTGRVVRTDGTVAAPGERVPRREQWLVPDPRHAGCEWRNFIAALESLGYVVEWRLVNARDYGAGTDRLRLKMVARRDGQPIVWPSPTHGLRKGMQAPVTAADVIDWTALGTSIFNRKRPLSRNTIRRLLDGATRGKWPEPYIDALQAELEGKQPVLDVTIEQAQQIAQRFGHQAGLVMAIGSGGIARDVDKPLPTITTGGNGASPHFIRPVIVHKQNSSGGREARSVDEPLPTIATRGAGHLAQPSLVPMLMGSAGSARAKPVTSGLPTITTGGAGSANRPGCARHQLIEPLVVSTCNSNSRGVRLASEGLRTITTARGGDQAVAEPVVIGYRIEILYRMLLDRELFNGQGFPPTYVIDRTACGRRLTRTQAVRMVGNSVSPPPLRAIAEANLDPVRPSGRNAA